VGGAGAQYLDDDRLIDYWLEQLVGDRAVSVTQFCQQARLCKKDTDCRAKGSHRKQDF
jgi:hypothetical protein